ncbi:MAG: phosphatidylinositol-specific phospholipase C [Myxococcales bacterium]|nr:phosphatidylinositol-specific phospholipase C [Myxococcales bacterium]
MRWSLFVMLAACSDSADPGWMAAQDDTVSLAALSIPGTHDTGARFEPAPGLAKTQELTLAQQLDAGVRYLDIRCRHFEDAFLIYHGPVDQNLGYDEVLATLADYLETHPTETVIVSVKEESLPQDNTRTFAQTFDDYLARAPDLWYLGDRIPDLGEVRGKLVLLRRFDAPRAPLGLDASPWLDNTTFAVSNGAAMHIQDAYVVTSNDAKWAAITALFQEAKAGPPATLYLDYTSGYQMMNGLPNIPIVAGDINARLDAYLPTATGRHGVLVMDFLTPERAAAVIDLNLR